MHAYLIVCGIILHLLVLAFVILFIIVTISDRRYMKKSNDERHLDELRDAYKKWRAWATTRRGMQDKLDKSCSAEGRKQIKAEMVYHDECNGSEYFISKKQLITLAELAKQHGWTLEEQGCRR